MPKVNVYLPDALHEQVKHYEIPLSGVCQQALEEEVNRRKRRMEATTELEQVAERLRHTSKEEDLKDYKAGFEVGAQWARNEATLRELESLASFIGSATYWVDIRLPVSLGFAIHEFNRDEFGEPDESEEDEGWTRWTYPREDRFVVGCVEGAMEVYKAVADLV